MYLSLHVSIKHTHAHAHQPSTHQNCCCLAAKKVVGLIPRPTYVSLVCVCSLLTLQLPFAAPET